MHSREDRRAALSRERRASRSGSWGDWRRTPTTFPDRSTGWLQKVTEVFANDLYVVLVRPAPAGVTHLAIRTASNAEPPWRDLQRIKNELFGPQRLALSVCPAQARLIDEADMYHLWVMPEGWSPGFGLHPADER